MRTPARITCVVVLAVLALVGTVPSSQAKGPTDVVVSGPGVDDVHLTFTEPVNDVDSGTLSDAAQVFDMWSPALLGPAPDLSAEELGPRYVLTWSGGEYGGADGADTVIQHAYPFAEGRGWVRFLPGQELWGEPVAAGWVRAPRLRAELVELGAVAESPQPVLAQPAPSVGAPELPAPAPADDGDAWSTYAVVPAGVLLAVAVAAGVLLARRRRVSR